MAAAKPLLAVLALAALALAWQHCSGESPPSPDPALPDHAYHPAAAACETTASLDRESVASAAAGATAAAPAVDLDHPFVFTLTVRVVDAFGLPVPDAELFLAPPSCGFAVWPERTDRHGKVAVVLRGRRPLLEVLVAVATWGALQQVRCIELLAATPRALTVVAANREQSDAAAQRPSPTGGERSETAPQTNAAALRRSRIARTDELDVMCGRTQPLFSMFDCASCHGPSSLRSHPALAAAPVMRPTLHPHALFHDLGHGRGDPAEPPDGARTPRPQPAESNALPPATGSGWIHGRVTLAGGVPAAKVPVAVWTAESGVVIRTATTSLGTFRLGPLPAGQHSCLAGGGAGGSAHDVLPVVPGHGTAWHPQLSAHSVIAGSARAPAGGPLVGWRVELDRAEGDWAAVTTTDEHGDFVQPGAPGPVQASLWPPPDEGRLPVLSGLTLLPDTGAARLALHEQLPVRARLRCHPGQPANTTMVEVRAVQLASGRAAWLEPLRQDVGFELGMLPAGVYRLEVGAPFAGWTGRIATLDGRGLWDLGRIDLPGAARIALRDCKGQPMPLPEAHQFCRRLDAVDVVSAVRREADGSLAIAPGDYLLLWCDAAGQHAVEFTAAAGVLTTIVLPRGSRRRP